jgi:hypothetical protein
MPATPWNIAVAGRGASQEPAIRCALLRGVLGIIE